MECRAQSGGCQCVKGWMDSQEVGCGGGMSLCACAVLFWVVISWKMILLEEQDGAVVGVF